MRAGAPEPARGSRARRRADGRAVGGGRRPLQGRRISGRPRLVPCRAAVFMEGIPSMDLVGRFGREEFLFLLPETDAVGEPKSRRT